MRRPAPLETRALPGDHDATLLDLVDNLLTKGVVLTGEVTLGLAGVDLVHVRLNALLCAADRLARDDR
jgi:hypothetical protein